MTGLVRLASAGIGPQHQHPPHERPRTGTYLRCACVGAVSLSGDFHEERGGRAGPAAGAFHQIGSRRRWIRSGKAFLYQMAHNLAIDWLRRRKARRDCEERLFSDLDGGKHPAADPGHGAARAEFRGGHEEAAGRAAYHCRAQAREGLTFEEIAEAQGIPLNTAASRLPVRVRQTQDAAASYLRGTAMKDDFEKKLIALAGALHRPIRRRPGRRRSSRRRDARRMRFQSGDYCRHGRWF